MTLRRTIVILCLLALAFFVYRGINPSGADAFLSYLKDIPVRLGLLSQDIVSESPSSSSGLVVIDQAPSASSGMSFVSTVSGGIFALEALVIPQQNTITIVDVIEDPFVEVVATGGSLTIVPTPDAPLPAPVVVVKKTDPISPVVSSSVSSSTVTSQDYALLNNLFK